MAKNSRAQFILKPISTLRQPLNPSIYPPATPRSRPTKRSDVCVVPAAGVIAEAMVALVLAGGFIEKFGGDSLTETRRNFDGYHAQLKAY